MRTCCQTLNKFLSLHIIIILSLSSTITKNHASAFQSPPKFDAGSIRRRLSSSASDACQEDMSLLEINQDLSASLQQSVDDVNLQFELNPNEYCGTSSSLSDGSVQTTCYFDYEHFTKIYRRDCQDAEAIYLPVDILLQCSMKNHVIDVEFANVPSCYSHFCSTNDVSKALAKVLDAMNSKTNKSTSMMSSSSTRNSNDIREDTEGGDDDGNGDYGMYGNFHCNVYHNLNIERGIRSSTSRETSHSNADVTPIQSRQKVSSMGTFGISVLILGGAAISALLIHVVTGSTV